MMHIALKTAVLTFATVLSAVSFIFLRNPEREPLPSVHAANGGVLSGWAWSDLPNGSAGSGGGWISFSSRNCDGDGDGFAGPNAPGACPPEGTGLALYEVSVSNSGTVSGYAWSEHVGWISFNQSAVDNCPSGSCRGALDTDTGAVMGWARACAVFANGCSGALGPESKRGGWEGWVSLSCANAGVCATSDYGVSSGSGDPCDWDGWAWGDAILGWIHVKGPTYGVQGTGDACVPPPAPPVIDQPNGVINATEFDVQLSTVGPGTYEGDVDVRATNPDGSVVDWSNAGLPNGGSLVDTFSFVGVPGKKYEFRFRARRGIGPWSDRATDGAVVINRPPDAPTPTTPVSGVNTYTLFPASPLTPILSWLFSDPDTAGWHDSGSSGTNPGAHTDADREGVNYQVEIYRNAALTDRVCCPANARIASGLEFNRNYYWRVRTTDNHDLSSS
ncbi:MAG: hypothetical protein Q8R13_05815, partial [bacterium]|nr:hypothetical protein [bacterium]MDZ4296687.1 hypothetical protein [Patescibacteria group bacterium]